MTTMTTDHTKELDHLCSHYSALANKHGDSPQSAQYADQESHWARFHILADIGIASDSIVADFGCGTAELLRFLRAEHGYEGDYLGIDIAEAQLALARAKFPDARFENRDVLRDGLGEEVDVIIINGVFNNKVPNSDGFAYMTDLLQALMPFARRGIAFNAMSSYVDYFDENLCYFDPAKVFAFCKENLSNLVTLRHDYQVRPGVLPFEFAVYVYRDSLDCRKNAA